ncbi:MAG: Chain length determinant protein tyrosine kinase EpsG [Phenylobacterium sp.]|nr:Chain length determinant protein tyrosine kinase EpsG [Phenylobacterium sp.]
MRANVRGAAVAAHSADGEDLGDEVVYRRSLELLTLENVDRAGTEAIQALATQLIAHHLAPGHRGLAVCGASLGVGVTFIAANLAVALAQAGVPTLLLDANLHDPGVQRMITPSRDLPGLQQLLRHAEMDRTAVERVDVMPNLSILYSGGPAPDASELIGGTRFREVVDQCLRDYAFTVIDTPAANRSPDVLRISRAVGHSLLIARRDLTYVDDVEALSSELTDDGVTVIGALLNGA